MIVGSVVTVGRLLAGAAPLTLLKVGVVAMATIDAVFIFGDFFGEQNAQFNAAAPAGDLPRLQVADIGDVSTDYGDYFVAGLVGGILAAERGASGARGAGDLRCRPAVQPALPRRRLAARHRAARARHDRRKFGERAAFENACAAWSQRPSSP